MEDKIYLADKETLDTVNRNVSDIHSRVGTTTDTGGSASAGTVFGKLNALISSIASHVANWTAARAAKVDNLDATVSSRQSEANALARYNSISTNTGPNNTASATGTLSQKLSYIINHLTGNTAKYKSTKLLTMTAAAGTTTTVLNITGAGGIVAIYTGGENNSVSASIVLDGVTHNQTMGGYSVYGAGKNFIDGRMFSSHSNANMYEIVGDVCFAKSCRITLTLGSGNNIPVRVLYNVYE